MDSVFLTKGTKLILTAWVPLTDLTLSRGPLVILQGSNCSPDTEKLRRTYGLYDAYSDTREGNGMLSDDPQNLEFLADRFVTAPFRRGDLVLFTIYSLHSFLTNATSEVRISAESKWFMKNDEFGPDLRYRGHTILKKNGRSRGKFSRQDSVRIKEINVIFLLQFLFFLKISHPRFLLT